MSQLQQLIDDVRQHTAGAGADVETLATALGAIRTTVAQQDALSAALQRLRAHLDAIDDATRAALLRAAEQHERDELARSRNITNA